MGPATAGGLAGMAAGVLGAAPTWVAKKKKIGLFSQRISDSCCDLHAEPKELAPLSTARPVPCVSHLPVSSACEICCRRTSSFPSERARREIEEIRPKRSHARLFRSVPYSHSSNCGLSNHCVLFAVKRGENGEAERED